MKDTLREVSADIPHSMVAVDITDAEHEKWFGMYKYDIPVLHLNGMYWAKHRLEAADATAALQAALDGSFEGQKGEPNAAKFEKEKGAIPKM